MLKSQGHPRFFNLSLVGNILIKWLTWYSELPTTKYSCALGCSIVGVYFNDYTNQMLGYDGISFLCGRSLLKEYLKRLEIFFFYLTFTVIHLADAFIRSNFQERALQKCISH